MRLDTRVITIGLCHKRRSSMNLHQKLELYRQMSRIRSVEETIADRYAEQKMRCPTHLSIGQEAVAAVYGQYIRPEDYAVSTHRAHAHYLAKGGDLKRMIAEIYGKSTGCSSGKGGSMHLVDKSVGFMGSTAIVGGTIPIGVGLAFAIKLKDEDRFSTIFLGDGATEEGVFYESVNFAVLKNLPVLFLCENNLYSVYSPKDVRQPSDRDIQVMVEALGVEGTQCDGYDLEALEIVVSRAVDYVRKFKKPYFLECFTYRWREHCGPNFDNDIGYRSIEEYARWKARDPLQRLKAELSESEATRRSIEEIDHLVFQEINEAFEYAENSPWPESAEIYTHEYAAVIHG